MACFVAKAAAAELQLFFLIQRRCSITSSCLISFAQKKASAVGMGKIIKQVNSRILKFDLIVFSARIM